MRVKLNKENFKRIDDSFKVLKEDSNNKSALDTIAESLNDSFGVTFHMNLLHTIESQPLFVMSVYPTTSTMDKIVLAIMNPNEKTVDTVKKLWDQEKEWILEIDNKIFDKKYFDLSEREMTALLLHEVGHVIASNAVMNRIAIIMSYEMAQTKARNKILLKNDIFRRIMALPIMAACTADRKASADVIKREIKADSFVKKMGYTNDLVSVLKKFISSPYNSKGNGNIDDNIKSGVAFANDTLDQFKKRELSLVKTNLAAFKENCPSPYIESVITNFEKGLFEGFEDTSVTSDKKLAFLLEQADKLTSDEYMVEFFIFGQKQLKRIDPSELDYIDVKINGMKTDNDRMMIVSYIHSKMDMVDYYISILNNQKMSKKYSVPYTIDQLESLKKRLNTSRVRALEFKLPSRYEGLLVAWPQGYEG